jgi:hypothetical protein
LHRPVARELLLISSNRSGSLLHNCINQKTSMNVVGVLAGTHEVTIRNMNESFVLPIRLSTLRRIVQYAAVHTTAYLAHYLCLIGIRSFSLCNLSHPTKTHPTR